MTFINVARREAQELKRRQSELTNRLFDVRDGPADPADLADLAERYDAAYQSLAVGRSPAPLPSESAFSYRRRLASGLQHLSPSWAGVDLFRADRDVMKAAEPVIFADVAAAAADRTRGDSRTGGLREIPEVSGGGHQITNFGGSPAAWLSGFAHPGRAVRRFQTQQGRPIRTGRRSI